MFVHDGLSPESIHSNSLTYKHTQIPTWNKSFERILQMWFSILCPLLAMFFMKFRKEDHLNMDFMVRLCKTKVLETCKIVRYN